MAKPLDPGQTSAFDLLQQTLQSWGLGSLIPQLRKLIIGGMTDNNELALSLSQTKEYKARFAANEARKKAGLAELTPAQYLATEEQYRNILQQYGIPKGFYDTQKETDAWLAGDVSPAELQGRVQAAADLVYNSPKEAQQAWDQFYGGGKGGAIAAILDPKTAAPLVQQQVTAAQIGGAALQQGLTASKDSATRFAGEGITLARAQQAYSEIAQRMSVDTAAGNRFGSPITQGTEEKATLEGNAAALQQQGTVYAEESSLFAGHGGGTTSTGSPGSNY